MLPKLYHLLARVFRLFPKTKTIKLFDMEATFFVPINNHYVCSDRPIFCGKRENRNFIAGLMA